MRTGEKREEVAPGLDDGVGRHPQEERAVHAAARAELLRHDVDRAVLAVAREDAVLALFTKARATD